MQRNQDNFIILMAFVIGLMIMAEFLLIHSRIQAEKEENSRVICSFANVGNDRQGNGKVPML